MAIILVCPNWKCRAQLSVPEAARGKRMRCSFCGTMFMVPANALRKDAGGAKRRRPGQHP